MINRIFAAAYPEGRRERPYDVLATASDRLLSIGPVPNPLLQTTT